ncbi:MAG: DNA mismatch repair endonuclease MutL [Bacteroidia bacterium]
MESIIQLLPDAIANQIAAGEVVQRPASVVKELLENAVDAGASRVDLLIKDAGKTLIQVTDNGCGMSSADARMAFERHATSKIRQKDDLFNIRTLGFRGEALASIAAVAQVNLRTRLHDVELGQSISIDGGDFKGQEACASPGGSTFQVKNLFFNVPARRNFLKSNPVETRHILNEFVRVAIPHPELHLTFKHNTTDVHDLVPGTQEERLISLFGRELEGKLISVEEDSDYVKLHGFVGDPSLSRKARTEQFFFVNGRYIRSPYLNHAISGAYEQLIPKDQYPFYCIFIEIDPVHVDINIHPTKTEVKFDDERTLYVLLQSMVKRELGGQDKAPIFDFSDEKLRKEIYSETSRPQVDRPQTIGDFKREQSPPKAPAPKQEDWNNLYQKPKLPSRSDRPTLFGTDTQSTPRRPHEEEEAIELLSQLPGGFALIMRREKLMLVKSRRAQQRVFYERFLEAEGGNRIPSQQMLFPQTLAFSAGDYLALQEATETLQRLGFDVQDFGQHSMIVYGSPSGVGPSRVEGILKNLASDIEQTGMSRVHEKMHENVARNIAMRAATQKGQSLPESEVLPLMKALFRCEAPAFSPSGKPVYTVIEPSELLK